jgi:hypothetical protein
VSQAAKVRSHGQFEKVFSAFTLTVEASLTWYLDGIDLPEEELGRNQHLRRE